jgi:hypothetical protein
MSLDTAAADIRQLLSANDRYWVENRASRTSAVLEFQFARDTMLSHATIAAVLDTCKHGKHVRGAIADLKRKTVRFKYAMDPDIRTSSDPRKAGSEIAWKRPEGLAVSKSACKAVSSAMADIAGCTATGLIPTFDMAIGDDENITLFACGAAQYCCLSLHKSGIEYTMDMAKMELIVPVQQEAEEHRHKRRRRG